MPCPEHIEKVAHVLSDCTDLDPVSVAPATHTVLGSAWKITGQRDGEDVVRMVVREHDGGVHSSWDPEGWVRMLRDKGVL